MTKRATTPTFVLQLPLRVSKGDERTILARLEVGRRLYNAVLHEALKRLSSMRKSELWKTTIAKKKGAARNELLKSAITTFGFSEYALHDFVKPLRTAAGWKDRISAQEAQIIATRVFKSAQEYAFGQRGKPRFKGKNRPLKSLEGKQNTTGIRFKKELGIVEWGGLVLPVLIKNSDYYTEALDRKTKFCRILWKTVKGQKRFYVQLMQEGLAPSRDLHVTHDTEIGLDLGPSTIAIVSHNVAALTGFAPSVVQPWREMRILQRQLDRSRRATNPNNYNPNGTIRKKTTLVWKKSTRYKQIAARLADVERKLAAARKRDHGELVNMILAQGNIIKTEALSHKALQKNFGRSAKVKASGLFFSHLKRKAESAGGKVVILNTRALAMSQYDHVSGKRTKKPLSQRHHNLADSQSCIQRDVYSAFLALNASYNHHNPHQLEQSWSAVEPLLRRTGLCINQSASGKASRFPTVKLPSERIVRQSTFGIGQGTDC